MIDATTHPDYQVINKLSGKPIKRVAYIAPISERIAVYPRCQPKRLDNTKLLVHHIDIQALEIDDVRKAILVTF